MNNVNNDDSDIIWMNMVKFAEDQTKALEREFHASRPKPRNRRMGFTGKDALFDSEIAIGKLYKS